MEDRKVGLIRITTLINTDNFADPKSRPTDVFKTPRMREYLIAKAHAQSEDPQFFLYDIVRDDDGILQPNGTIRQPTLSEKSETGWYDLPGPAKLWPDSQLWYQANGLEVDPEKTDGALKALAIMESGHWVEGWVKAMIRGDEKNRDYSIRWEDA
jgi:hypothetical protein